MKYCGNLRKAAQSRSWSKARCFRWNLRPSPSRRSPFAVSTAALAPALLGVAAGGAARGRFSERAFRRIFFFGLLALGANLASRALI